MARATVDDIEEKIATLDRRMDALKLKRSDTSKFQRAGWKANEKKARGEHSLSKVMGEGERAAKSGKSISSCPYDEGSEDREIWVEAYEDWKKEFGK